MTIVSSGVIFTVSSGQNAVGDTVLSGGTEIVLSGGTTHSATISGGGTLVISGNGTTDLGSAAAVLSGTVISSGGILELFGLSGAPPQGNDPTLANGAIVEIGSGTVFQVVSGNQIGGNKSFLVESGGTLQIQAGGAATGVTVFSGGSEYISSGGFDSGSTVSSGGLMVVSSGATTTATTLIGVSGSSGSSVASGVEILSGGTAFFTNVLSGGKLLVSTGIASGTNVSSGGKLGLSAGGLSIDATIFSSGTEIVSSGATASGSVVSAGGSVNVSGGTTISALLVGSASAGSAGAHENVFAGGVASNTTLSASGASTSPPAASLSEPLWIAGPAPVTAGWSFLPAARPATQRSIAGASNLSLAVAPPPARS